MDGLTEGRIVHYVMPNGDHVPAIVVNAFSKMENPNINLIVFVDGTNDVKREHDDPSNDIVTTLWERGVPYSEDKSIFSWHWIEKA